MVSGRSKDDLLFPATSRRLEPPPYDNSDAPRLLLLARCRHAAKHLAPSCWVMTPVRWYPRPALMLMLRLSIVAIVSSGGCGGLPGGLSDADMLSRFLSTDLAVYRKHSPCHGFWATALEQPGMIVARWSPVDGGETRASAIPDVDVSRSDGHDKAPEGAQAVLGLWSSA
ncbi:MAG: hypothetical protein V2A73_15095, partial [Pseudomonadota bacterium]